MAQPAAADRLAFGVPLDADDLIGIAAGQFGGHRIEQGAGGRLHGHAAGLEQLGRRQFDPDHVAIGTDFDAGQIQRLAAPDRGCCWR